jgi:hypothetical protein
MIARKKAVIWKRQLGCLTPANQKCVVAIKSKDATGVRPSLYFKVNTHSFVKSLVNDRQIVKRHFSGIAGVNSNAPGFKVCSVGNTNDISIVNVKIQLIILNSYLKLIGRSSFSDCG